MEMWSRDAHTWEGDLSDGSVGLVAVIQGELIGLLLLLLLLGLRNE